MQWVQLAGAVGVGAIVTKLLDVFWLARITRETERRKWLRDRRLAAYADVARDFLSFGFSRKALFENPFEAYAVAARAILLAEDDALATDIDLFIVDLDRFYQEQERADSKKLYEELHARSRDIIRRLRTALTASD
jgi:hypothetical protein